MVREMSDPTPTRRGRGRPRKIPADVAHTLPVRLRPAEKYPTTARKGEIVPCPKCRALRLPTMVQAVVVSTTAPHADGTATYYFRCRACEHRFRLEIADHNPTAEEN